MKYYKLNNFSRTFIDMKVKLEWNWIERNIGRDNSRWGEWHTCIDSTPGGWHTTRLLLLPILVILCYMTGIVQDLVAIHLSTHLVLIIPALVSINSPGSYFSSKLQNTRKVEFLLNFTNSYKKCISLVF